MRVKRIWMNVVKCLLLVVLLPVFTVTAAEPIEFNVWLEPLTGNQDWVLAGIELWKKENPQWADVKITTGSGWLNVLKTQMAGGITYDIVQYSSSDIPGLVYNSIITDLRPFIAADPSAQSFIKTLIPSVVQSLTYGSGLYGLPTTWSATAVVYNKDLFDARGAHTPSANWTQDDMIGTAKKLTFDSNGDGITDTYGWIESNGNHHRWPYWIWSHGGEFYNSDLTECTLNAPAALAGAQKMMSLVTEHGVTPKFINGDLTEPGIPPGTGISGLFNSGKAGMYQSTRIALPKSRDFAFGVAPLPYGPVSRTAIAVTDFWSISPQTKYPEMAWSLIKFLATEKAFFAGAGNQSLATSSILRVAQQQLMSNPPEIDSMNWIVASEDSRRADTMHPAITRIKPNWDDVVKGNASVTEVVEEAVEAHNALLKEAYAVRPW